MLVGVTLKPKRLLVLPGLDNADVTKCDEEAFFGSMQGTPLMKNVFLLSAMQ